MDHPLMITWMQTAHALTNPHERPLAHVVRRVVDSWPEPSPLALLRPLPMGVHVGPRDAIAIRHRTLSDACAPARHAA